MFVIKHFTRSDLDVFAGYSYVRENPAASGIDNFSMNGGSASFAYNATLRLSAIADLGGYPTNNILGTGIGGTLSTYLFVRAYPIAHESRITPFGQVLLGVAHVGGDNGLAFSDSNNTVAMAIGGGVDCKVSHGFSLGPLQADYLMTRFIELGLGAQSQNSLRVSSGVVFHF
jgi:hypothetical protein